MVIKNKHISEKLKEFNKNVKQFMLIYAQMKEEPELKKLDTDRNVREYRKERWEKALKLAKGNEMKAFQISESEDLY